MAAQGPVRRVLLYGIVVGALVFTAIASAAPVKLPSAAASAPAAPSHGERGGTSKADSEHVPGGHFCRWFPRHGLCVQSVNLQRFCDRRPDHRLCGQTEDDRFCTARPNHPLCDDDFFCRRRADHPLCNEDPPPSPS